MIILLFYIFHVHLKLRILFLESVIIGHTTLVLYAVDMEFYAAETWTYQREDIRRLAACEMRVWRRMEKISWRDLKTDEEVLQLVQEKVLRI